MFRFNPFKNVFDVMRSFTELDDRYVNITGDTMTGSLVIDFAQGGKSADLLLVQDSTNNIGYLVFSATDASSAFVTLAKGTGVIQGHEIENTGQAGVGVYYDILLNPRTDLGNNTAFFRIRNSQYDVTLFQIMTGFGIDVTESHSWRPAADSTYLFGEASRYWEEGYFDKIFLNSTAILDGATAGKVDITGDVDISGDLSFPQAATISTTVGDLTIEATERMWFVLKNDRSGALVFKDLSGAEFYSLSTDNTSGSTIVHDFKSPNFFDIVSSGAPPTLSRFYLPNINYTGSTTVTSLLALNKFESTNIIGSNALIIDKATTIKITAPKEGSSNITLTDTSAIRILNTGSGAGTLTNQYGIYIENLTEGVNNYGLYIAGADTYAIWVASGDVKFDVNSATALLIEQNGVKDNTFVVDTTNGAVGVNMAPDNVNYYNLVVKGGITDVGTGDGEDTSGVWSVQDINWNKFIGMYYEDDTDDARIVYVAGSFRISGIYNLTLSSMGITTPSPWNLKKGNYIGTLEVATLNTNKTWTLPNIAGTLVTTNGALANVDLGAYNLTVGGTIIGGGEKCQMTPIGGFAIKLTNKTGSNTIAGQLVKADLSNNDAFILASADDLEHFGIVLDSGVADGSEAWIVIYGIADVAMQDNTAATRGNWVRISTSEDGYADATNVDAPAPINQTHFTEVGHCIETVSAGGGGTHILARCVLHFN